MYSLVLKKSVLKDFKKIPEKRVEKILSIIHSLTKNPRPKNCEKLTTREEYRVRSGKYRILYEISDTKLIITVVKVGHRKNVY